MGVTKIDTLVSLRGLVAEDRHIYFAVCHALSRHFLVYCPYHEIIRPAYSLSPEMAANGFQILSNSFADQPS